MSMTRRLVSRAAQLPPLRPVAATARTLRDTIRHNRAGAHDLQTYFFGMTRFSIFNPNSPSLRLTRETGATRPEEYAEILYSEDRMAPRCDIFCNLAAPLYQSMASRHRYEHVVFYSSVMPSRWRRQLEDAAREYPVLKLTPVESDQLKMRSFAMQRLKQMDATEESLVFAFRVDDDDLLADDYLDQVAPLVTRANSGYGVSLSRGYTGIYQGGKYTVLREFEQPLIAIGLGTIGEWFPRSSTLTLPEIGNHRLTHFRRTVLLDAQRPTTFWTRHAMQDSAPSNVRRATGAEDTRAALLKHLKPFKVVEDVEPVFKRFPTLRGHFDLQNETQ